MTDDARGKREGAAPPLTDLAFNILVALADRELHGYALIKELRGRTGRQALRTGTGYAALARLQDDGLVEEVGDLAREAHDQRRRYYGLTDEGRASARAEAGRLAELVVIARDKHLIASQG